MLHFTLFLLLCAGGIATAAQTSFAQESIFKNPKQRSASEQDISNPPPYSIEISKAAATFDGDLAYEHLKEVCSFGRRFSNSRGMVEQQQWLQSFFLAQNAEVIMQPFAAIDPRNGQTIQLANLIVRWHPERRKRLLFCCHYDTRPFPDSDKRNPQGIFIGANDGASGVAVLCELGRNITLLNLINANNAAGLEDALEENSFDSPDRSAEHKASAKEPYGIDLAFFDGEELVYERRRDPMFLGSTFFANQYVAQRGAVIARRQNTPQKDQVQFADPALISPYRYVYAILVDMVGDKDLQIFYEGNSLKYAPRLTKSIWGVAKKMKVKSFIARKKHELRDDHLPLNQIAKIPTCDIIDFDFPSPRHKNAFWHTEADTPENCSAASLQAVGSVLLQWLIEMQALAAEGK